MADNNGVSVLGLHFNITYLAELSLTGSQTGIPVLRYKVGLQNISGDTKFHGFNIDTLLVPTRLEAVIRVYKNQKLLDSLTQPLALDREQVLLPVSGRVPLSSLYITFDIVRVVFTENGYRKFIRTTNEINHYYGYRQAIKDLHRILLKTNDIHPEATALFYNYAALTRLAGHIRSHHFDAQLHLDKTDPLHFRRAYAAVLRKQTRMKTLSGEVMKNRKPPAPLQKVTFARQYTGLSIKAFALSKQYQPYIAGSFREYARIIPGSGELKVVRQASRYFDQNDKPGQATVAQEIYKDFIDAASWYFHKQAYVGALDMLANAASFEKAFREVKRIPEFDTLLLLARDGLASSYLKVAALAFRQKNDRLADGYLKSALNSLQYNSQTITASAAGLCYTQTAKGFNSLAAVAMENIHLHKALSLLGRAEQACPGNPATDSLRLLVCSRLLQTGLDKTRAMLLQNQTDAAFEALLRISGETAHICHTGYPVAGNPSLRETAGEVFGQLLADSQPAAGTEDITVTMNRLRKASLLQKKFSLPASFRLDSLIRKTTVPFILSLTGQANLEIWRKDFSRADSLFQTALHLGRKYGVDKNETVSRALSALFSRIQTSGCHWKAGQARQLLKQTSLAVKAYRLSEAESYFLKAKKLAGETRGCVPANAGTDSTIVLYNKLFRFTHSYHSMTQQLFNDGFVAILPQYVRLDSLFNTWQLKKTGLPYTRLFDFVQKQQEDQMAQATAKYFIHARRFREALRYLLLVSDPAKYEKEQKQIARGFVRQHLIPGQELMTNGALGVFRKSYRKELQTSAK